MEKRIIEILKNTVSVFMQGNKRGRDIKLYFSFPSETWVVMSVAMNNLEDEKLLYSDYSLGNALTVFEENVE